MIHPYLVFRFEMYAMQKWFKSLVPAHMNYKASIELQYFIDRYCPSPYWNMIDFDLYDIQPPTKREKITYFHSLGMTSREIQKAASASPNTIQTIIKTQRNLRHYNDDPTLNKLIEEWQKLKQKLPQEIFIKYL